MASPNASAGASPSPEISPPAQARGASAALCAPATALGPLQGRDRTACRSHTQRSDCRRFCCFAFWPSPSVRPKLASPALGSSAHPRRCWLARARACELACERACNIKGWTFDLNRHSQCRRSIRWRTLHHSSHAAAGPNMHVGCMAVDSQAAAALTTQTPQPHLGA